MTKQLKNDPAALAMLRAELDSNHLELAKTVVKAMENQFYNLYTSDMKKRRIGAFKAYRQAMASLALIVSTPAGILGLAEIYKNETANFKAMQ